MAGFSLWVGIAQLVTAWARGFFRPHKGLQGDHSNSFSSFLACLLSLVSFPPIPLSVARLVCAGCPTLAAFGPRAPALGPRAPW